MSGRAWHKLLRLVTPAQWRTMLLGGLLSASTTVMGCALLGISGWFITATAIAGLVTGALLSFDIFTPSASIRLLSLGRTASRYAERLLTHDVTLGVLLTLRVALLRGWARPAQAQRLFLRPARLLFRMTRDLDALEGVYLRLAVPVCAALSLTALLALLAAWLHPMLGVLVLLWLLPGTLGMLWWIARRSARTAARHSVALERLRARAIDAVAGQTELLMSGQAQAQYERVLQADARLAGYDAELNRTEVLGGWLLALMQAASLAVALLAGAWLMQHGLADAPLVALMVLAMLAVFEPFAAVRRGALEAGKTWLAARRLAAALPDAPDGVDTGPAGAPHPAPPAGYALCLSDLHHSYPAQGGVAMPVLCGLSLAVHEGEKLAIVGASGSGKSTLLALIAGELAVQRGSIRSAAAVWLPQRVDLFADTLRDNLNLAQLPLDDQALWQALEQAGLAAEIRAMDAGLDTPLGEGGLGLSGGQARRLALARLLLGQHPLLLLDEPTESLDTATASAVLHQLGQALRGQTVVLATHLAREAQWADRIICLEQGAIALQAQRGTPEFSAVLRQLRGDS